MTISNLYVKYNDKLDILRERNSKIINASENLF